MLQSIGDKLKSHRWLAGILLGAIALFFVVWGAYGVVNISFGPTDFGLKVNGDTISTDTLQNAWQQQQAQYVQALHGAPLTDAQKSALQQQLVDQYIRQALLQQRSAKAGYRTSDQDVEQAYQSEAAFQVNGKFDPRVARAALLQAGMTPDAYEADRRQALQIAQLTQGIQLSDFLTPSELARIYALENEQREVSYALLPLGHYVAGVKIDDARIAAWYHTHQNDYLSPDSVDLQYAQLTLASVEAQVPVTQADLQAYYTQHKSSYSQTETRHAHHILIAVANPKDPKSDAAALAKAQQILAQLKAGKDFAALAKKYSADPGSAAQGGDLGWAERSIYVPAFASALFGMQQPGLYPTPVKTQFGYHIIRLDGIRAAQVPSLDTVRAQVEQQFRREQASALFGDKQDQLQQALDNGAMDVAAVARQFGLQAGEIKQFTAAGGGAPLGNKPELLSAVFSDDAITGARIVGPLALGNDSVVIFKVLAHHPPAPQPIASVRQAIVDAITKDQSSKAARAAADAAVKRLQQGESLASVAKSLNVMPSAPAYIGRSDPQVPAQVRDAAFAAPEPQAKPEAKPVYQALTLDDGSAALLEVSGVKPGQPGVNSKNDEQLVDGYMRRDSEGEMSAYVLELQRRAHIERNPDVFQ
jgi:peptidyl-prolyl cis-trans isomerase D